MDLGSIFLIIAILALVAIFIGRPLIEAKPKDTAAAQLFAGAARDDQKRSALLAERDRVLNALSELDFDHAVGKIPEEDYPEQRRTLLEHGAQLLRELDGFETQEAAGEKAMTFADSAEARLEAAIAVRRMMRAPAVSVPPAGNGGPAVDDDIEIQIAARRRLRLEKAAGFCPQCGGPVQKSDRFCPKCGAAQK
jgi:hypothetical protein